MSNLRKKIASENATNEVNDIEKKLYQITEDMITKKAAEIGYTDTDGSLNLVEANMNMDLHDVAKMICDAVEEWGKDTKENYM